LDLLSDVLSTVRLHSAFFGRFELGRPWGFSSDVKEGAVFHYVDRGSCRLEVDGAPAVELAQGDVVMLPRGVRYVLRDASGSPAQPLDELICAAREAGGCSFRTGGGEGEEARLLSGCFRFEEELNNPLLRALPRAIHISADRLPWLRTTLQQIAEESRERRAGSEAVIRRLSDALFVQLLRAHLEESPAANGWLRGVADAQIGRALEAIHRHPEQGWSVATLAAEAGLSRSSFAERFAEVVGETPMQYLTRWRLERGAALLRNGASTLGAIALTVGYESEASFSRAFKRWFAVAPGEFRRRVRGSAAA
jgi:AraC-like DNA-binding protein